MVVNYIDLILIVLVLVSILNGVRRGLLLSLVDLLGWLGGLVLALSFAEALGKWLEPFTPWSPSWDAPVAFLLIIIVVGSVAALVSTGLARQASREEHTPSTDRVLGALPGLIGGVITAALAAMLLLIMPLPARMQAEVSDSMLAGALAAPASEVIAQLVPIFSEVAADIMPLRTISPDSEERVELPFTVVDIRARPDLEAQMLDRLNQERTTAGLTPLTPDPALAEVARGHAADMFTRGYFSHLSPEGHDPFDRISAAGITYLAAGENLALAPTLERAHAGLMASSGHRENILRPLFGRVGIGIMDGGIRGIMVVQIFRD